MHNKDIEGMVEIVPGHINIAWLLEEVQEPNSNVIIGQVILRERVSRYQVELESHLPKLIHWDKSIGGFI